MWDSRWVCFPILQSTRNGALYLLFLMLLVWCGDIAAYYVGRAIGKHKLAPRISPGKSWEGAIASVLGAVTVGLLVVSVHRVRLLNRYAAIHLLLCQQLIGINVRAVAQPFRYGSWYCLPFCVNVSAQFGDLVESALKRGAGVEGFRNAVAGTWRRARPNRCATVCAAQWE